MTTRTEITIPNTYNNLPITKICSFEGSVSLTKITVPKTVKTIPDRAFYNCSELKTVVLPGAITNLPCDTFTGCVSLTSIQLGSEGNPISVNSIQQQDTIPTQCTITLYTKNGSADDLTGAPWGWTNATIIYEKA